MEQIAAAGDGSVLEDLGDDASGLLGHGND